jgi:hypothetical protein
VIPAYVNSVGEIGNCRSAEVSINMTFKGEFWSRKYESDIDVSSELQTSVTTPLASAFVDACMSVEDSNLAIVVISVTTNGDFQVKATGDLGECAVVTKKCPKCASATYKGSHPFNGCETVLIEEIMAT